MDLSQVAIVLVRPSRPANVAAACRAMKNMGLRDLRIVEPPTGLDDRDARAPAYGAWDVLDRARAVSRLAEAVADTTLVAGTTGRSDVEGTWTPRQLAAEARAVSRGGRLALVFGPESSGLTTLELGLCHVLVHVRTDPAQPSLNLAQAVLLFAYELRLAAQEEEGSSAPASVWPQRAPVGDLERALADLREALLDVGYLDPLNPDHILIELRRLLARAGPTPREVNLLRGLARQIGWAGRVARGGRTAP
jgi:TrmH family RNA methyltransferase